MDCSHGYSFLWTFYLDQLHVFGMSYALASHLDHATNLYATNLYATNFVDQLVSKNVIGFVDIQGCVSMSISVSTSGIESVGQVNKIDSNVFCDGVSFQKR